MSEACVAVPTRAETDPAVADGGRLNDKQRRFAAEYLVDINATQAAIRAGYSPKTAGSQAHDLLKKPEIQALIQEKQQRRAENVDLKAERVLQEFMRVAFADIGQAFAPDGGMLPLHEMPEEVRRALAGVEVEELYGGRGSEREHVGRLRKVKFWNKNEALTALGKHLKLFTDVVEAKIEGGVILLPAATSVEEWEKAAKGTRAPMAGDAQA